MPLAIGLVVWFTTSVYLSLNFVFNLFIETDPYIAKSISAFSFIWLVVFGIINYKKTGDIVDPGSVPKGQIMRPTCKTCKQK